MTVLVVWKSKFMFLLDRAKLRALLVPCLFLLALVFLACCLLLGQATSHKSKRMHKFESDEMNKIFTEIQDILQSGFTKVSIHLLLATCVFLFVVPRPIGRSVRRRNPGFDAPASHKRARAFGLLFHFIAPATIVVHRRVFDRTAVKSTVKALRDLVLLDRL